MLPPNFSSFKRLAILVENGKDAQTLNTKFAKLSASSTCESGTNACIDGKFAQCVNGAFVTTSCGDGLTCVALPLVNSAGTVSNSYFSLRSPITLSL